MFLYVLTFSYILTRLCCKLFEFLGISQRIESSAKWSNGASTEIAGERQAVGHDSRTADVNTAFEGTRPNIIVGERSTSNTLSKTLKLLMQLS